MAPILEKGSRLSGEIPQIPKSAYEVLEFIKRSGATNMLDEAMVLKLAREWDLTDIAD